MSSLSRDSDRPQRASHVGWGGCPGRSSRRLPGNKIGVLLPTRRNKLSRAGRSDARPECPKHCSGAHHESCRNVVRGPADFLCHARGHGGFQRGFRSTRRRAFADSCAKLTLAPPKADHPSEGAGHVLTTTKRGLDLPVTVGTLRDLHRVSIGQREVIVFEGRITVTAGRVHGHVALVTGVGSHLGSPGAGPW
jgi:hypothetical protein